MNDWGAVLFYFSVYTAGVVLMGVIIKKAGFSPWLSLFLYIPLINIITLCYVAFAPWPSLESRDINA